MKTRNLLQKLSKFYPKTISCKYHDPVGLQTGKLKEDTKCIFLCLDFDEEVFNYLKDNELLSKIDLIITHHPFIFGTKSKVFKFDNNKKILCEKIDSYNIPVYSYHTNFDEGKDGMNDALANKLELLNIVPLDNDPMARGGELKKEMDINEFANYALQKLNLDYGLLINSGTNIIKKVAIVGGGGSKTFSVAQKEGYDIFISGDAPHHLRRDVVSYHFNYFDVPHEVEKVFMEAMQKKLLEIDSSLEILSIDHEQLPQVILKSN